MDDWTVETYDGLEMRFEKTAHGFIKLSYRDHVQMADNAIIVRQDEGIALMEWLSRATK
jgi:hypothetical protein